MTNTEIIILGQGIAGTMLGYFFENEGIDFRIIDNEHKYSSSLKAAGNINPVTGRRYVKSWMIDDLLPFAEKVYLEMEQSIGVNFMHRRNIIRTLHNIKQENDWAARIQDPEYSRYLKFYNEDVYGIYEFIQPTLSAGEIIGALQINLPLLLQSYRTKWLDQGKLIHRELDYADVRVGDKYVHIDSDISAAKMVFAEGYKAIENPFFNHLPFDPVKGEALIIKIENGFTINIRERLFITPIGGDLYWVGSGYDKNHLNQIPDPEVRLKLTTQLDSILKTKYEIIDHVAGVRPSTKNRRPILVQHPEFPSLYAFNGMGTKGSSLAPYFAHMMKEVILDGKEAPLF
jgi:glycine oxidase